MLGIPSSYRCVFVTLYRLRANGIQDVYIPSYDHMVTSSCPPLNCQGQPSDSLHRGRMSYVPIDVLVARVSLAEQLKGSCKRLQGHSLAGGFSVYKTCRKLHHIHFMQSVRMTLKNTFSYIFSFHIHVVHVNLSSFLERTYKA